MQHNLLKKYEDEVNMSAVKQGLINQLKIELDKSESRCKSYETQLAELKPKFDEVKRLEKQNKTLKIDVESYKLKYEKCKKELAFFDEQFFQEIDNLKSKYGEAVKLNKYYENLLFNTNQFDQNKLKKKNNRVKFAISTIDSSIDDESSRKSVSDMNMKQFSDLIINELEVDDNNNDQCEKINFV